MNDRTMPPGPVIPVLGYDDLGAAIDWLCTAFGFAVRWRAGDHRAILDYGDGAVMLGPRRDGEGRSEVMVRVADAQSHHEHARDHGARILNPPRDFEYGERQYDAEDPGGHRWVFSESIADVAPEQWGGTPGPGR